MLQPPAITSDDFDALTAATTDKQVHLAFGAKFDELRAFLNRASAVKGIQVARGKRPKARAFLDFRAAPQHWYTYHRGGRNEAQLNIGMHVKGFQHVRVGLGFEATTKRFGDPITVTARYEALVRLLAPTSPVGDDLRAFVQAPGHGVEYWDRGAKKLKVTEKDSAAFLTDAVGKYPWIFVGRILERERDGATLADPNKFADAINTVFTRLLPIWRLINNF